LQQPFNFKNTLYFKVCSFENNCAENRRYEERFGYQPPASIFLEKATMENMICYFSPPSISRLYLRGNTYLAMSQKIFFTPGPSELYFTVEEHLKRALKEKWGSVSHRSQQFKELYRDAVEHLKLLLNIPDNYRVVFTSSATEVWERLLENCVEKHSYHLVNGAFSERFYQAALSLKKSPVKAVAHAGSCVSLDKIEPIPEVELIAITQNETSTGAAQPPKDIYSVREQFPDTLIAVEIVSSVPVVGLDLNQVDTAYFSVQKGLGLPAGLGVWLVNEKCIAKAEQLSKKGLPIGTYHSLLSLAAQAEKFQTPETPNVLGIYLLNEVMRDMLDKGLDIIRRESKYKAALLYQTLMNSANFNPFVADEKYRSETVVVAETNTASEKIVNDLLAKRLVIGKGYGPYKGSHIRIANFPTHSKEQIEMLTDFLSEY